MENVHETRYVQAEGQRRLVRCFDPVTGDVVASWPGDLSGGVDRRLLHRGEIRAGPTGGLPLAHRWQPLRDATGYRLTSRLRHRSQDTQSGRDQDAVPAGGARAVRAALARRSIGAKLACSCESAARFRPMSACW